jgi:hypothetical protein
MSEKTRYAMELLNDSINSDSSGVQEYKCAIAQVLVLAAIAEELEILNKLKVTELNQTFEGINVSLVKNKEKETK